MSKWSRILELQDQLHPGWRTNSYIYPLTLYTSGLASEVGEVCDQVIHMNNGGSQVFDAEKWNPSKLLEEILDTYVMLVLVSAKSGFTEKDFNEAWKDVELKLVNRVNQRHQGATG